jgi:hypothetical protein
MWRQQPWADCAGNTSSKDSVSVFSMFSCTYDLSNSLIHLLIELLSGKYSLEVSAACRSHARQLWEGGFRWTEHTSKWTRCAESTARIIFLGRIEDFAALIHNLVQIPFHHIWCALQVFADHASSIQPIDVPRTLLWSLRRRFVYFSTAVSNLFKGKSDEFLLPCPLLHVFLLKHCFELLREQSIDFIMWVLWMKQTCPRKRYSAAFRKVRKHLTVAIHWTLANALWKLNCKKRSLCRALYYAGCSQFIALAQITHEQADYVYM